MERTCYDNMRTLFIDICDDKKDLLIDKYEEVCDIINDVENSDDIYNNMSFNFDWILNYNEEIKYEVIYGGFFIPDLVEYIKVLSKYNKYNKLNILNNNSKLPEDIIFKLIIEYL